MAVKNWRAESASAEGSGFAQHRRLCRTVAIARSANRWTLRPPSSRESKSQGNAVLFNAGSCSNSQRFLAMSNHTRTFFLTIFSFESLKRMMKSLGLAGYCCLILAGLLISVLIPTQASATVVDFRYTVAGTSRDGSNKKVFVHFLPNCGITTVPFSTHRLILRCCRTSEINAATLTIFVGFVEGARQIAVNGMLPRVICYDDPNA